MIGYYPYVVTTLLLIYAHSTSQMNISYDTRQIQKELLHEDSYIKQVLKDHPDAVMSSTIVCNYDQYRKQDMCDDAMVVVIARQHGEGAFGKFLPAESDPPAPAPANQSDRYKCVTISVDEPDVAKPMYWCMDRKYKNAVTGEVDEIKGFFISTSEKIIDRVFMFKPSETSSGKVSKWAKIHQINTTGRMSRRYGEGLPPRYRRD